MFINSLIKKLNKKTVIILLAVLLAAAVILITAFSLQRGKRVPVSGDHDAAVSAFDTTLTGNAELDPENEELHDEEGTDVKAEDLPIERGKSNGIDVSKWQGKIDWKKVKNSGVEFAFIRIGYRGENGVIYKDAHADYNIQQAQKAGVLVGVYFFSTAINEAEALEEARWTLQAIAGYSISYPVVYDCEGFRLSGSRMYTVTAAERTDNALCFLKTVAAAGYDVMLYGAKNELQNSVYWDISKIQGKYKVWVAQYSGMPYPQKNKPDYSGRCDAWQYTNKGTVSGISGNVDMVVCYFTKEKAAPKDKNAAPDTAPAPLTDEEKLYTAVNEKVTAKELTNLRAAASTKSDIVSPLKNGEIALRIGIGSNGWSKLQYKGKTVYAITSYLTTDLAVHTSSLTVSAQTPEEDIVAGNTFTQKKDRVTAKDEVNLRDLPSTDGKIIATLKSGTFLERTAVSNRGWSRLKYNGQTVYAVTSYLTDKAAPVSSVTPPVSETDGFTAVNQQVTAKSETNLRNKPSTENSEVVYTLKNGEYVKRIGVHTNGWSKLEYNGQTVYAITSYLLEKAE